MIKYLWETSLLVQHHLLYDGCSLIVTCDCVPNFDNNFFIREKMTKKIIDLSVALETGIISDPPMALPKN